MAGSHRKVLDPESALENFVTTLNKVVLRAEKQHGSVNRPKLAKRLNISTGSVYAYLKGTTLPPSAVLESMLFELRVDDVAVGQLLTLRDEVEIARRTWRDRTAGVPVRSSYAAELPRDIRQLLGRENELAQILAALTAPPPTEGGPSAVCVLSGVGGVGKTALAVRAARSLEKSFPDGCLFIDLRGYGDAAVITTEEAADKLLRQLRTPPESVPAQPESRLAALREILCGGQYLLLLDNALDTAHIQPLLPAEGPTRVLVTSRSNLNGLDDACRIPVKPLSPQVSTALVQELTADLPEASRLSRRQLESITDACHGLPVAIKIAAAFTHTEPWPEAHESIGIELFHDGERDLQAVFEASVTRLSTEHAAAFTALGVHGGRDFDLGVAAALADTDSSAARRAVRHLIEVNLLTATRAGRYQFHDLVRAFARRRAESMLGADARARLRLRSVDHYLALADAADRLLTPHRHRGNMAARTSVSVAAPRDYRHALSQLSAERDNLLIAASSAFAHGLDRQCWQLAFAVREFAFITHDIDLWTRTHELALAAAERAGDTYAVAVTCSNLGLAAMESGECAAASRLYRRARAMFTEIGDGYGAHIALAHQAWAQFVAGDWDDARADSAVALEYLRVHGTPRHVAILLRDTATIDIALGRCQAAVPMVLEALEVFRTHDLHIDETIAYNVLGRAYQGLHALQQASTMYSRAAEAAERSGSTLERTRGYAGLGEIAAAQAKWPAARMHFDRALAGYGVLRDPVRQAEIRARLAALPAIDVPASSPEQRLDGSGET